MPILLPHGLDLLLFYPVPFITFPSPPSQFLLLPSIWTDHPNYYRLEEGGTGGTYLPVNLHILPSFLVTPLPANLYSMGSSTPRP